MMISDLYIPTCGIDFLIVTCVCDSLEPVAMSLAAADGGHLLQQTGTTIEEEGRWFRHFEAKDLAPGAEFTVSASHARQTPVVLKTSTLNGPSGRHRIRFGILADPHCSDRKTTYGRQFDESFDLFEKYTGRLAATSRII